MSMNPRNIVLLLKQSFDLPQYDLDTLITNEERSFANHLENLIKESVDTRIFFETFDSLSFNEKNISPEAVIVDEDCANDFEVAETDCKKVKTDVELQYKIDAVNFWHSGKKKKLSFESVKHRFSKVPNVNTLYKWEQQIEKGGTRSDKLLQISNYVLDHFKNATEKNLPIHDNDLKRWALQARENVNLPRQFFTASTFWVHSFKTKHGIVSRKINKFVTQKYLLSKEETEQKAIEFVSEVKAEILLVGEENVFNSDQSGFNLEVHAGRTLALKGSMKVEGLAQSLNSLTHSYTIQPVVSADGELKSPMLIVLQETGGKFGPIVENTIYKANNIIALPSKSDKLTSEIATQWFSDVFLPNAGNNSVLLLDSWTGQTKTKFDNIDRQNKNIKILTIPPGTTGLIQPLDVYGFRLWKNFLRQFSDIVMLYNYDINLHLRNNVLKIQSLIHNQFSSPRFRNLFKYAWWKSGYIAEKPERCETPADFCFKNCNLNCEFCSNIGLIRCAWCNQSMCMQHFFSITDDNSPHYCNNFIQQPE